MKIVIEQGSASLPVLYRGLHGPPLVACSCAVVLSRLGSESGVQTALIRCYDEEWLSSQPGRPMIVEALRQIDQASIGSALDAGLSGAPRERELQACFDRLTLALSALRVLVIYGEPSPLAWWTRALSYGPSLLPRIRDNAFGGLASSLTDHIRAAALRGLLDQYSAGAFEAFTEGILSDDISVMRTSIMGMRRLRDLRALPLLQPIAFAQSHPLALETRKAIESIAGANAESLVLMRSSHADANVAQVEGLVRPAPPPGSYETGVLLRSICRTADATDGGDFSSHL